MDRHCSLRHTLAAHAYRKCPRALEIANNGLIGLRQSHSLYMRLKMCIKDRAILSLMEL